MRIYSVGITQTFKGRQRRYIRQFSPYSMARERRYKITT